MFDSLVRWFGRGAGSGRSGRGAGPARRFTPRLEALEGRAVPGGVTGEVLHAVSSTALLGAKVSCPSHQISLDSKPAGVEYGILPGVGVLITRSSGEEIPQTV
jgi:hypothetical protein